MGAEVIAGRVARVLLFDERGRVLLLFDPDPEWGGYWYPPGGRIEAGESPEDAARRELIEELGVTDAVIGPTVLRCRAEFVYRGRTFDNDEWHLLGRVAGSPTFATRPGDSEASAVARHRWWHPDEISEAEEPIYPVGVGTAVRRLLATGPPPSPWLADDLADSN